MLMNTVGYSRLSISLEIESSCAQTSFGDEAISSHQALVRVVLPPDTNGQ